MTHLRVPMPQVDKTPGLYVVCTDANTDYPQEVPAGAKSVILWFETAAADDTVLGGRVGVDDDNTVETIDNTDSQLGYHPPMAVEYSFNRREGASHTLYLHVGNATALAVARGTYLF